MDKDKVINFIWGAIVICLLGLFGYLIYIFIKAVPDIMAGTSGIQPVLAAVAATMISSLMIKWYEKYLDRKNQIKLSFRERKIDDCAEMILFVHDHNASDELKKELGIKTLSESEIQKCIHKFTSAVIQWGSPEMIQAWNEYRKNNKPTPKDGVKNLAKLLIAVRKEMGHESISEADLLRFLVKDWDEHQEKQKQEEVNNAE